MLKVDFQTKQVNSLVEKLAFYRLGAKKRVDAALALHALLIESEAKRMSPVDTGLNRASIATVREDYAKYRVAANAKYALFLEFGTIRMQAQPFLLPAYHQYKSALLAALREAMKYKL